MIPKRYIKRMSLVVACLLTGTYFLLLAMKTGDINYQLIAETKVPEAEPGNKSSDVQLERNDLDSLYGLDFKTKSVDLIFNKRQVVQKVNCKLIVSDNQREVANAWAKDEQFPKVPVTSKQYINMTSNCEKFVEERGYISDPLTEIEKEFPIAYGIVMYKDIEQTERLLRAIYRPQNIYCIHVDLSADKQVFEAVSAIANCFENVFTSRRIYVTWGTYSVLEPNLICMEELWNKSVKWKYFINLTGQEFPLKTNYHLVKILMAFNGSNDIMSFIDNGENSLKRIENAGPPPHGIVYMKGGVHIVASRGFVDFALHDKRAQDFLKWSKNTTHTSEIYFNSIHGNKFLEAPGSIKEHHQGKVLNTARFKKWSQHCLGIRLRSICMLNVNYLSKLATSHSLFANKFLIDYSPSGYDCLEELQFNRTRDQYYGKETVDTSRYIDGGYLLSPL